MKRIACLLLLSLSSGILALGQEPNIALGKPVTASSEAVGSPAAAAVDGMVSRYHGWYSGKERPPHSLEINLQHYYDIRSISIFSGIPDNEMKADELGKAAGFYSIKNFRLQYWDDANWSDLPGTETHENRQTLIGFHFNPSVTTYRIRIVCDDGEPINILEWKINGSLSPHMPVPPDQENTLQQHRLKTAAQQATIKVEKKITGKSMQYVGYNQGYFFRNTNVPAWVEYSQVNAFRVWTSLNAFAPIKAFDLRDQPAGVESFDSLKAVLRSMPRHNRFIKWDVLQQCFTAHDASSTNAMQLDYALQTLKKLKVDVILQINSTDFSNSWPSKWKMWMRYYALAYYAASTADVTMFAMQNEPNHRNSGPVPLDKWIMGMQIVSDAVHAAINDVNRVMGKHLTARFVGPVTAGQNTEWWAAIARAIRTDYHGKEIDHDLIDIFSTHSYNSPAAGYEERINNIRKILEANHPLGNSLPIVYTEIGRWMNAYLIDKEETMDSPALFTEWAGIYSNNMRNGGYGMWAFKFANTASSSYPRGIKSGHHLTWQGKRIVEDAYINLALHRPVKASVAGSQPELVTDADKSDSSAWTSDAAATPRWIEIELDTVRSIGAAVIYSGSAGGEYTSPDRVRNFSLQYYKDGSWYTIPGMDFRNNKYAQVFQVFDTAVRTNRVRFYTSDKGRIRLREIKLFAAGQFDGLSPDYNISGIQRTGEVVRLFAKGFKGQRPLLQTSSSVADKDFDHYTSYDSVSGNYYMWLVQRGSFDYQLKIDVSELGLPPNASAFAETVSDRWYGELNNIVQTDSRGELQLTLKAQSVVLLTIPAVQHKAARITAHKAVTVQPDTDAFSDREQPAGYSQVALDASYRPGNKVTYVFFELPEQRVKAAHQILLKVNGYCDEGERPYRLHVYGLPREKWKKMMNWGNAACLDKKEAYLHLENTNAFIAGELAFDGKQKDHYLDITAALKGHPSKQLAFVFIRETRQLGDDEDKGRKVLIADDKEEQKPALLFW